MSTKKSIVKDKPKLNICIDFILFGLLMAMAGIGLLIKYVLVSGETRNANYGENINLLFWGLDRHEWGTIHLIVSLIFILFLVLHIVFHWKMITCLIKRLIPNNTVRIWFNVSVSILGFILFFFAFLITPEQAYHENNYRNRVVNAMPLQMQQKDAFAPTDKKKATPKTENESTEHSENDHAEKKHKNQTAIVEYEVLGTYTLNFVANKYSVPCSHLCNELCIPQHLSNERLGRLRKKYSFTMSDVSKSISAYKNKPQQ